MPPYGYGTVVLEKRNRVTTLTLNRPSKLNSLNAYLVSDIHDALDSIAADTQTKVLIITGAGRSFSAGADVNRQLAALEDRIDPSDPLGPDITEIAPHIRLMPQPVIAAINGLTIGAGLSTALASDIRVASEDATFSCMFVKRSLVPDAGCSFTLPKLVGMGTAMEMALTGNIYDAEWALHKGLVNCIVPANELMNYSLNLASEIVNNPPIAVTSIKQLMYNHQPTLYEVLPLEHQANTPTKGTDDRLEAARSFLEKRAHSPYTGIY